MMFQMVSNNAVSEIFSGPLVATPPRDHQAGGPFWPGLANRDQDILVMFLTSVFTGDLPVSRVTHWKDHVNILEYLNLCIL